MRLCNPGVPSSFLGYRYYDERRGWCQASLINFAVAGINTRPRNHATNNQTQTQIKPGEAFQ